MQLLCFDSFLLATVPAAAATGAGAATGGGAGAANDQDVSDYTFTPLLTGFKTCTALLCGAIYTLLYKNVITYVLYGGVLMLCARLNSQLVTDPIQRQTIHKHVIVRLHRAESISMRTACTQI